MKSIPVSCYPIKQELFLIKPWMTNHDAHHPVKRMLLSGLEAMWDVFVLQYWESISVCSVSGQEMQALAVVINGNHNHVIER